MRSIRIGKATAFFIAAAFLLTAEIISFAWLTDIILIRAKVTVVNSVLESLFILMPYFFLPPSWRRLIWMPLTVITLFFLTDLWYLRQFGNFYDGDILLAGNIADPIVLKSALKVVRWEDMSILLPPLLLIPLYVRWRKEILHYRYSKKLRVISILIFILIPVFIGSMAVRRKYIQLNNTASHHITMSAVCAQAKDSFLYPINKRLLANNYGSMSLIVNFILSLMPEETTLSDTERGNVVNLLGRYNGSILPEYAESCRGNSGKNLILIIVESLNSTALNEETALEACPTMLAFIKDSCCIYADKVYSQARSSADGQMILNTGLLPLRDKPTISRYGSSDYPSLAKALKQQSDYLTMEIIGEGRNIWNHNLTTLSYGYDVLRDSVSIGCDGFDEDVAIIGKTVEVIDTVRTPFLIEVTTISMHSPYDEAGVNENIDRSRLEDYDENALNYLRRLKSFDSQLGRLIDALKRKNLYDNTIIAITADHSAPDAQISELLSTGFVPLLIINSGIGMKYEQVIGQADIFPTIMDVMGIEEYVLPQTGRPYLGLGHSLLRENPRTASIDADRNLITLEETKPQAGEERILSELDSIWNLSELAIRSRFFDGK